ncbi:MAG: alpha/beta hydrolase [Deltaproteobacteria bacterium]|nr:alpha/beta hydrolase [Deltaproteobacteria bacterium]
MPRWLDELGTRALERGGFRLRSFNYRGSPVYFVDNGERCASDAPVMAVFPGFGDTIFSWTRFLLRYGRTHRVLGLDFPGFSGKSPHPPGPTLGFAEEEEVAELFLRDVAGKVDVLVGNSMGGWIALNLAHRHPDKIAHVVALNPGGVLTDEEDGKRIRKIFAIKSYADYIAFMKVLWHRMPLYLYGVAWLGLYQFTQKPLFQGLLDTLEQEHFLNDRLKSIETPITVIWGLEDKLFRAKMGRFIAESAPRGTFHGIERAGHMPHIEAAERVYAIIDAL